MSFESKMKKRGNKKLNQFAKNPYRKSWFSRIPIWTKVLVPSALAAGLIVGVFVGVLPNMGSKATAHLKVDDEGVNNNAPASEAINKGDHSVIPGAASSNAMVSQWEPSSYSYNDESGVSWSQMSNLERYPSFVYNNQVYRCWQHNPLDTDAIKAKVNNVTLFGQEKTTNKVIDHEIGGEIYSVRNIANDVAYALRFAEDDKYYPYIATIKGYDTIGDFLNKCAFDDEVDIYRGAYSSVSDQQSYTNISKEKVKEILFDDLTIVGTAKNSLIDSGSFSHYLYFRFRIDSLKLECDFSIFETGVFEVNALGVIDRFYMGGAKYTALTDYLLNNTTAL